MHQKSISKSTLSHPVSRNFPSTGGHSKVRLIGKGFPGMRETQQLIQPGPARPIPHWGLQARCASELSFVMDL